MIFILIDQSGSMQENNALYHAKRRALDVLSDKPPIEGFRRVTIISFDHQARKDLTERVVGPRDLDRVRSEIESISVNPDGATIIGDRLHEVRQRLEAIDPRPTHVEVHLLSDLKENPGGRRISYTRDEGAAQLSAWLAPLTGSPVGGGVWIYSWSKIQGKGEVDPAKIGREEMFPDLPDQMLRTPSITEELRRVDFGVRTGALLFASESTPTGELRIGAASAGMEVLVSPALRREGVRVRVRGEIRAGGTSYALLLNGAPMIDFGALTADAGGRQVLDTARIEIQEAARFSREQSRGLASDAYTVVLTPEVYGASSGAVDDLSALMPKELLATISEAGDLRWTGDPDSLVWEKGPCRGEASERAVELRWNPASTGEEVMWKTDPPELARKLVEVGATLAGTPFRLDATGRKRWRFRADTTTAAYGNIEFYFGSKPQPWVTVPVRIEACQDAVLSIGSGQNSVTFNAGTCGKEATGIVQLSWNDAAADSRLFWTPAEFRLGHAGTEYPQGGLTLREAGPGRAAAFELRTLVDGNSEGTLTFTLDADLATGAAIEYRTQCVRPSIDATRGGMLEPMPSGCGVATVPDALHLSANAAELAKVNLRVASAPGVTAELFDPEDTTWTSSRPLVFSGTRNLGLRLLSIPATATKIPVNVTITPGDGRTALTSGGEALPGGLLPLQFEVQPAKIVLGLASKGNPKPGTGPSDQTHPIPLRVPSAGRAEGVSTTGPTALVARFLPPASPTDGYYIECTLERSARDTYLSEALLAPTGAKSRRVPLADFLRDPNVFVRFNQERTKGMFQASTINAIVRFAILHGPTAEAATPCDAVEPPPKLYLTLTLIP